MFTLVYIYCNSDKLFISDEICNSKKLCSDQNCFFMLHYIYLNELVSELRQILV